MKLELSDETKKRLAELRELSERAEGGSPEAFQALRNAVRSSSDEVIEQSSNYARRGQRLLCETLAAGEPLGNEAMGERLNRMRTELGGESPTALEALLIERIVSSWLFVMLLEVLMSAQLSTRTKSKLTSPRHLKFYLGWLESAHRRLLASIRELAQLRKLQAATPSLQVNIQNNLVAGGLPPNETRKGGGLHH